MTAVITHVAEVLAFLGIMFSSIMGVVIAIISHRGAKDSKAANDAVNHRHEDQPRLFDLALKNHDIAKELQSWKRSYSDSPWKDGEGVQKWLSEHEEKMKDLEGRNDEADE